MKKNKSTIFLIILLSLTIVILTTFMIFIMNKKFSLNFKSFFTQRVEELQIEETYKNTYDKINIKTDAADVYIKKSENEDIQLKVYAEKNHTNVIDNETELNIEVKQDKCIGICINNKVSKVELYIPENYEKEIKIDNNYGDIEIESFEKLNLNIKEDAGDIKIEKANIVNIDDNYGNIEINEINEGAIKESAGDIKIIKVNSIDVKNNYGDVKITEINEYVKIDGDAGDIKIDNINITKDSSIETNVGKIKINKTNEIFIEASTDLGKTSIKENHRESEITLNIKSNVGDIKID